MFDIFSNRELYTDLQLFFIYSDNDLISGIKIYKRNSLLPHPLSVTDFFLKISQQLFITDAWNFNTLC